MYLFILWLKKQKKTFLAPSLLSTMQCNFPMRCFWHLPFCQQCNAILGKRENAKKSQNGVSLLEKIAIFLTIFSSKTRPFLSHF